jgi:ribonuclease G
MKSDSAKCTILGMSEFGLVEMTRQRNRESLMQTLFTECPYCFGRGLIKTHETMMIEVERALKKAIECHGQYGLKLVVHPELFSYLEIEDRHYLNQLAKKLSAKLEIESNDLLHMNDFHFVSLVNGKKLEV